MTARAAVAAMTAYTLELREAEIKLNQNESPFDFPFKDEALASIVKRAWHIYPDFESTVLRTALANAYALTPEDVLVGNGSNELLAAAVGAFVGPGTPVVFARPTFALYDKLVTVAGGLPIPIDLDPTTGLLPLDTMLDTLNALRGAVVIVCSPNNPTGGVLPPNGIESLLATGATVLFDRAYGDFANDDLPPLHDRLVTFSTFSKAWGLAALRVGWLASTAATCREIRKVKLPYSLNIISESIAALALDHREVRDVNVASIIDERERMLIAMRAMPRVTPFPSRANFIAFQSRATFEDFLERGILIRKYKDFLRVSVGTREQNDAFLAALQEVA
ncbi:MAG TPA: aminotransferase class I/II-fold pyridoxal phosphate-dependent enzyme [Thermoanaerobaculia bacterium]|jgi:histidinol-phosphate aminotransferase|nr:aminotransferase class I/II-fold pyridoxal phosphate-dependent enzyme [Thermoanaerobaculia bacterium]